jgi:hypothetical protein
MPTLSSVVVKEKIPIKNLKLILSESDNIIECIKKGMTENSIKECNVTDVSGKIETGLINCMDGHKFKSIEIKDIEILKASGHFKQSYGELWGKLNVFTSGRKPLSGTLVKGTSKDNFVLTLTFVQ